MFISWNWLGRHVDTTGLDPHAVATEFTLKVAELDGVTERGQGLEKMRTVRVLEVVPVEGAKKLSQVTVQDGDDIRTIVCGAPNAKDAVGHVCVLAPPGAVLPDGTAINTATIRGIESAGMLASEAELGLSDEHDGIIIYTAGVAAGQAFSDAVPVKDVVWEVDNKAITHRPDLWGHRGIAREVALLTGRRLKPLPAAPTYGSEPAITATVIDPALCPRYTCAAFRGVQVAPSPQWLQALLRAADIRPISNVVDLTNFVMLDTGNPIHAFDRRFVAGAAITVRRAADGETIRTLDGQDRVCDPATLLICDAERPVAIAGVMGGENSEIRDDTAEVVLEAATFDAATVRRTATRLGLRTDSSARFEKSLDPALAKTAADLFTRLMIEVVGATVVSPLIDIAAPLPAPTTIRLNPSEVSSRLGVPIPIGQIRNVLGGLGFDVQDRSSGDLHVVVPTWRATRDVAIPADLIEEIGRIHGYTNIPPKAPRVLVKRPQLSPQKAQEKAARRYLSATAGFNEVLSYGFTWRPILERLGADLGGRLRLKNPYSAEMDMMRRSMIPNLLKFSEANARGFETFGLYEIGRCFDPIEDQLPRQHRHVAWTQVHAGDSAEALFRAAKGTLTGLLTALSAPKPHLRRPTAPEIGWRAAWTHPTRSLVVELNGAVVGWLSILHPRARQVLDDLRGLLTFGELDLDLVLEAGLQDPSYTPLPKFPASDFDVSFEVPEAIAAADLEVEIRAGLQDTELLERLDLFDNYHLGDGRKSVSFKLTFRAKDRSLKDKEVHKRVNRMIKHVTQALGATLRGG